MVTLITQKETFFIEKTFSIIEYISKKPRNRFVVVLQTTAGWRKAPALAQRVCTQGVASLRSISSKTQGTQQGLEWFGPPERNTLRPLWVVLPSHESEEVRELESVWRASVLAGVLSLLYIQGEHVHWAGPRHVDPAMYYKLHFGLQCLRSGDLVVGFRA